MKKCWLCNRTVIITGASGGIGRELTKQLILDYGCKVIGIGRNEQKMLNLIADLGEHKHLFDYHLFDISLEENWIRFSSQLQADGIIPDILINNAGVLPNFCRFIPQSSNGNIQHDLVKTMDINYLSSVYSISELLPMLSQSNTPAIINIASSAALASLPGTAAYSASKAALKSFTESLIVEQHGKIYVGLICPGFSKTDIFRQQHHSSSNKAIDFISMPADKMARKIISSMRRKRSKSVIGIDAKLMDISYRLFGVKALRLFGGIMKASKIELFNDIFNDDINYLTTTTTKDGR